MQILRCTAKLAREMGLRPPDLHYESLTSGLLAQWHANLLHINRRKTVLFVNDRTLFNFVVLDVSRRDIQRLPELFLSHFSCVIADENIPKEIRAKILSEYSDLRIAKSANRSVLGSANDIALHYKYSILDAGGVHSPEVPEIIRKMNRMPLQAIKYKFPIEELRNLYAFAV